MNIKDFWGNMEIEGCGCGCEEECGHDEFEGETTITMSDAEGNEYEFMVYDEMEYNDESYLLLLTLDDEDPELVIVKVVETEDGNDSLMSIDEDEFDKIFEEYERLCDEEEEDEEQE